jgi:hypothetical protein
MGYNLTNERIQDTYQQILQISGSVIVDGTGSVAAVSFASASYAAYAVTASYALNAGGAATWPVSGTPSGLVSSSAQLADDISGSFTSTSASIASDIATNKANISTNSSNISIQTSRVDSLVSATSSYAVKSSDNSFSGLQTFNNVAINGTASIAYLQSITGSAKVIGDAFIILNADTPTQRYAGVKVYDSGSSPISTGSFQWDSVNNDWFYEYEKDATDYAVALFGPEFATKGTPTYPTSNTIQKGTGGHHLADTNITDDGTSVTISSHFTASMDLRVDGQIYSPTFAGSIASSTSSIDFDNGNFATLNCASSTFLANPSNLKSGTTYTIIITNGANISGYGTAWLFAGGTEPTLSANTDVLTCVSDGTSLYATALADFS